MMPQQKHLRELLREDQEPFLLKSFIADKRSQLKRPSPTTQIQVTKRKPISNQRHIVSNFTHNLCKDACFFSFNDSIDSRTSPLFQFKSPLTKSPNARTATLLLEASIKIQKQSSKSKTLNRNNGFGLFGSFLKRLTQRNRTRKQEISGVDGVVKASVREILRWDSSVGRRNQEIIQKINSPEISNGRLSSAVWSDSNEGKSLDFDFGSSQSEDLLDEEEIEFIRNVFDDSDFTSCEKRFCESPFRFVLTRSPSSGVRTPAFSSPATSPTRHEEEEKENCDVESLKKYQEEEDKEQCSPVSVLDPPFEDDDDENVHNDECEDDEELDSYAIVQRAKSQLLRKLRRFEKLAELDPIELEKRMLDQEVEDEDEDDEVEIEDQYCNDVKSFDSLVAQQLNKSGHIPMDMKSLVLDLIDEESREKNNYYIDREVIAKRVCKRLESWKEVECNTIDMMIEQDLRSGTEEWKKIEAELKECSCDIEVAIVGLLLEELTEDLMSV